MLGSCESLSSYPRLTDFKGHCKLFLPNSFMLERPHRRLSHLHVLFLALQSIFSTAVKVI